MLLLSGGGLLLPRRERACSDLLRKQQEWGTLSQTPSPSVIFAAEEDGLLFAIDMSPSTHSVFFVRGSLPSYLIGMAYVNDDLILSNCPTFREFSMDQ